MEHSADYVRTPLRPWTINGFTIGTLLYWPLAWFRYMWYSRAEWLGK